MVLFHITGMTSIDLSMKFELSDEEVKDKHPDEIVELLQDKFYNEAPTQICAHCSGWGQSWSRDIADEYEFVISDKDYEVIFENDELKGSFLNVCDDADIAHFESATEVSSES